MRSTAATAVTGTPPRPPSPAPRRHRADRRHRHPAVTAPTAVTALAAALAIVNEAYRALGDGVARAAEIDLALRLGVGHAVGPFERPDRSGGPAAILAELRRYASMGPRFVPAPALMAAAARRAGSQPRATITS